VRLVVGRFDRAGTLQVAARLLGPRALMTCVPAWRPTGHAAEHGRAVV